MNKGQTEYLAKFIEVILSHPGKTIRMSKDGVEALDTNSPPDMIIEGRILPGGFPKTRATATVIDGEYTAILERVDEMNIDEAKQARKELEGAILASIQEFEDTTKLFVRNIQLSHLYDNGEKHTMGIDVEVEL